jgi:hypothetical protein
MNWQEFTTNMKEGQTYRVFFNWSFDKERDKMNRLSKKGYFKRTSDKGAHVFTRTSKPWKEGDSLSKPIQFSLIKIRL